LYLYRQSLRWYYIQAIFKRKTQKVKKKLSGLARKGCTRDIALPLTFHHTCAAAQVIIFGTYSSSVTQKTSSYALERRTITNRRSGTSNAREQSNTKPRQATPKTLCGLGANLKPVPETRRRSTHIRFGWSLASAWFEDSSQAKSVRPLFILQRRIPKLLAIPRITLLF